MSHKLIRAIFIAFLSCISFAAYAVDGSNIRIMVLQDDADPTANCVSSSNAAGKQIATKIGEQFNRYGYTVVPREVISAEMRFDLSARFDKSKLIDLAQRAKSSGRAELDIQALVIYQVLCDVRADSVSTNIDVDISGTMYDTVARRELGDFGPIRKSVSLAPNCEIGCRTMGLRNYAGDMATVVAEQARNKLKLVAGKAKADGTSDRIVTYNVRLENLSKAATRIRTTMEKEFPGAKGIVSVQRNGNLVTFGYQTSASADKVGDWLEIVIEDLGLENVSLNVDGNNFTISNDGPDSPPAKKPTERLFK